MTAKIHAVRFFPSASDRKAWKKIQERPTVKVFRDKTIVKAEKLLGKDIPELPADKYMDFQRNGERRPFEKYYFGRRNDMETLVLAEVFEHKGRFMDGLINYLWAIMNEPTWCISAHAGLSPKDPLPDFKVELIDLFSAETSSRLATVLQLMEPELNAVSPTLVKRMKRLLIERAIIPAEKNMESFLWREGYNNWTPWICSNLMNTANTVLTDDPKRLAAYVKILQPCMDKYYARFLEDGGCEEGSSYWGASVGRSMLYNLYLYAMTDGKVSIFKDRKYRKMCEFIADNWIGKGNFTTFADCPPRNSALSCGYISRTAELLPSESLKTFERTYRKQNPIKQATHEALIGTIASLCWEDDLPAKPRKDFAVFYKDLQLLLVRSGKLFFSAIGYRNAGGGHHHLDVGNFLLAVNGTEEILDLGNTTYKKDTFSEKRFENPVLNSLYHNVPVFDGKNQGNGIQYAAKNVVYSQKGKKHVYSMDLASAYPAEIGIRKCVRTFVFDPAAKTLTVTDDWEASKSVSYAMTLFTKNKPGAVVGIKSSAPVCKTEKFTVTDLAQITNWGKLLWKTNISFPKAKSGKHQVVFTVKGK